MQEINLKTNKTGLKIFVNGTQNILAIPNEDLEPLITNLEIAISKHFESYMKKKRSEHFRHSRIYTNKK